MFKLSKKLKNFLNKCKKEYDKLVYTVMTWWKSLDKEDAFILLVGGLAMLVGVVIISFMSK